MTGSFSSENVCVVPGALSNVTSGMETAEQPVAAKRSVVAVAFIFFFVGRKINAEKGGVELSYPRELTTQ